MELDLFESQYIIPNGMSYNSYLIADEKIAVMDSVDARKSEEWMAKLSLQLGDREPDYLIVQHMEPDHSASIIDFVKAYPNTTVVASAAAFKMMNNYFETAFSTRALHAAQDIPLTEYCFIESYLLAVYISKSKLIP